MGKSVFEPQKRRLLAIVTATMVLLGSTTANAVRICDPHFAYLDEYGFLDRWGPSLGDIRRLNRDQWRAVYYGPYYDPVTKALRKRCPPYNRWRRYYW